MAERSRRIAVYDAEKIKLINPETLSLLRKYEIDLSLRELSENTLKAYRSDLYQWWIYVYDFQGNKPVTEIDEDDLTEFFFYCKQQGNNSRRMRRRMSSVSAFFIFLKKKKIIRDNPMEYIDRPAKDTDVTVQTYLTEDQVADMKRKLLDAVDNAASLSKKHYYMTIRTYALFSLSTMARVNAVGSVRWEQIDYENRTVRDVREKEGYIVDLYFSKEVSECLSDLSGFRRANDIDDNGYVFVAYDSGRYDRPMNGTLADWCRLVGEMIDIPTLHPHDFRHSAATILRNNGMALEDVSKLLGHKGTDVTIKHYLKLDTRKLQSAKDQFEI